MPTSVPASRPSLPVASAEAYIDSTSASCWCPSTLDASSGCELHEQEHRHQRQHETHQRDQHARPFGAHQARETRRGRTAGCATSAAARRGTTRCGRVASGAAGDRRPPGCSCGDAQGRAAGTGGDTRAACLQSGSPRHVRSLRAWRGLLRARVEPQFELRSIPRRGARRTVPVSSAAQQPVGDARQATHAEIAARAGRDFRDVGEFALAFGRQARRAFGEGDRPPPAPPGATAPWAPCASTSTSGGARAFVRDVHDHRVPRPCRRGGGRADRRGSRSNRRRSRSGSMSTVRSRLRTIAAIQPTGAPSADTTRRPITRLPGVCPLKAPSHTIG